MHMRTKRTALALVGTNLAFCHGAMADTLHRIAGEAYEHHDSGWIFPQQVGDFTVVGIPVDVNGTIDVMAAYAQTVQQRRTVATVEVYPSDPSAAEASLDHAKAARQRISSLDASESVESAFPVGAFRGCPVCE